MSLIKLALLNKKAGALSEAGSQITHGLFNQGHKELANMAQKDMGQLKEGFLGLFKKKPVAPIVPKRALRNANGALVQNYV